MQDLIFIATWKEAVMIVVSLALIFISVKKNYEPLLLLPIGLGIMMVNLPFSPLKEADSILALLFEHGIKNDVFPLLIFISVGAMIDFKPIIQRPWLVVFGIAGQFGIFATMVIAILLGFSVSQSASIGIIGSADGPTSIFVSSKLAPELLGIITLAAYSYMALVPVIQPPIMKLLTSKKERRVKMPTAAAVVGPAMVKLFPYMILLVVSFFSPMSVPLIGFLMFGNILLTSTVTDMLARAAKEYLAGIVTLFLGLAVGSTMRAEIFLRKDTLLIFGLGLGAFAISTAFGVMIGKMLYLFKVKVNPLLGAAGLSSFPMSARLVHQIGQEADYTNFLLMHAAAANVSGQIASVVAGGVLLDLALKYLAAPPAGVSNLQVGLQMLYVGMTRVFIILCIIAAVIYLMRAVFKKK